MSSAATLPPRSILRRAIAAVLVLELVAAVLLTALTAAHERRVRYEAFEDALRGKAAALLGAVSDSDDAADDVMLDTRGLPQPGNVAFRVFEIGGAVLGQSREWPFPPSLGQVGDEAEKLEAHGRQYLMVALRGVRVVDPGEPGGGKVHPIAVLYGAPTAGVEEELREAIRFYALAFALVLVCTAALLAWVLRRALAPLRELAVAAGGISTKAWQFQPPPSASSSAELAPLSAAIQASVQRLERSFAQQRRFTSDAAHELKTGVAIVKSSLQLLALRPRTLGEYRAGLDLTLRDCERMEQIVKEMLLLARSEYESAVDEGVVADLAVSARYSVRALAPMADLAGVTLRLDTTKPARVGLSAKDCGLLCTNLLENAIRHSAPGSDVLLFLRCPDGAVRMEIIDQGEGIAAEVLPHIFEPFFRGDSARDRNKGGSGLGLAICKAICEKAGGSIEAESRPGLGTTVAVRLPSVPGAPHEMEAPEQLSDIAQP